MIQIMIYVQQGATVSYWDHFLLLLMMCLLFWLKAGSAEEKTFQGPLWLTSPAKTKLGFAQKLLQSWACVDLGILQANRN